MRRTSLPESALRAALSDAVASGDSSNTVTFAASLAGATTVVDPVNGPLPGFNQTAGRASASRAVTRGQTGWGEGADHSAPLSIWRCTAKCADIQVQRSSGQRHKRRK